MKPELQEQKARSSMLEKQLKAAQAQLESNAQTVKCSSTESHQQLMVVRKPFVAHIHSKRGQ